MTWRSRDFWRWFGKSPSNWSKTGRQAGLNIAVVLAAPPDQTLVSVKKEGHVHGPCLVPRAPFRSRRASSARFLIPPQAKRDRHLSKASTAHTHAARTPPATHPPLSPSQNHQPHIMTGRGGGGGRRVLLPPINFLFRLLQQRTTVQIWLYEQLSIRIVGTIRVSDPRDFWACRF